MIFLESIKDICQAIKNDPANRKYTEKGIDPLFHVTPNARILIVSQAPSRRAQVKKTYWDDLSGDRLRKWMGITRQQFYDSGKIAVMNLDFYYPGKGKSGDLPPRKGFAKKWHPLLLQKMPHLKITLLVGSYAQKYYLGDKCFKTLSETVQNHSKYLPNYFPLVHPSPLNYGWIKHHPWYMEETIPELREIIGQIFSE